MSSTGRCRYCKRLMFGAGSPQVRADPDCMSTRDHMIPRSLGPVKLMDQPRNMAPACHGCNQVKGDAPHEVFAWWVRQPAVIDHTPAQRRQEFKKFCYALMLVGFKAARRMALDGRPPPPKPSVFTFQPSAEVEAENDEGPVWLKGKRRATSGRFAKRTT